MNRIFRKLLLIYAVVGAIIAINVIAGGSRGSHPDHPNNGKHSPRFYSSPRPVHPQHP